MPLRRRRHSNRRKAALHVRLSRYHDDTLMRIGSVTLPDGTTAPTGAIALHTIYHRTRAVLALSERHQDLVEHDVVSTR